MKILEETWAEGIDNPIHPVTGSGSSMCLAIPHWTGAFESPFLGFYSTDLIKLRIVWCSFGAVAVTKHGLHRHLGRSAPIIEAFYREKITGYSPGYSMESP